MSQRLIGARITRSIRQTDIIGRIALTTQPEDYPGNSIPCQISLLLLQPQDPSVPMCNQDLSQVMDLVVSAEAVEDFPAGCRTEGIVNGHGVVGERGILAVA